MSALHKPWQVVGLVVFVCALAKSQDSQPMSNGIPLQTAMDVSVCKIAASPDAFDGMLVRIDAYISRGFEDSTLHDPSCPEEALVNFRNSIETSPHIWAEFADQVGYWHVKGFAPLVKNEQLRQLRATLLERGHIHQMTRATMTGTFFAGRRITERGKVTPLRGYGHMGCCSLFVISSVDSVQKNYSNTLDYAWGDWNIGMPDGCYSEQMLGVPTNETIRKWQQDSNEDREAWHTDPRQTAEDELRRLKAGEFGNRSGGRTELLVPKKSDLKPPDQSRPTETLLEMPSTPYLKRYEYIEPDRVSQFMLVVTRPYWLENIATSAEGVIWVPTGSSLVLCAAPKGSGKKH